MLSSLASFGRRGVSYAHHILVQVLFGLFERLLPVQDDLWCFCTWGDYSHTIDNPRAVFEVVKDDPAIQKIVLQKNPSPSPVHEGRRVRFVEAESIRGAYCLARSRVVLTGYALQGIASYSARLEDRRHHVVQLWHGIPLKRIGRLVADEEIWEEETPRYDATVSSSGKDRAIMAEAFAPIPEERVWLTGLPRNDLLLKEESELPADYRGHLETLEASLGGRRFVLYAPTWRKDEESLYDFSREEQEALERVLERHGAALGIRGHVKVRKHEAYSERSGSSALLNVNGYPDVNVVLRRTDVLITDYSSLYIDYLLLDRPIVHFAYDLSSYVRERGFVHDPERAFGGPCAETFEELIEHLDRALGDPAYFESQRRRASELFHDHPEASGAAVCTKIRELVAGSYSSNDQ